MLADAGLYGIPGPEWAGGVEADFLTTCAVAEALASGCLTTAFVWMQHLGAVRAAAASETPAVRDLTPALCRGELRSGVALTGTLPGPPQLRAVPAGDSWIFTGMAPFVSGWDRIDVVHTAARTGDNRLVWGFVDARASETIATQRLEMVALNATNTVRIDFRDHPLPADRISSVAPYQEGVTPPETLRMHASLALGVVDRCRGLLGPTPLDQEVDSIRQELDRLDPNTIQTARGAAGELAWRAAGALMVSTGARSLLTQSHAQLLARNALFTLVYALRPGSKTAVLERLTTPQTSSGFRWH
jgi:hypothetical protein